eukprot:COSAG06_NODE_122_length_23062_cov_43.568990_12_plen_273_part_00
MEYNFNHNKMRQHRNTPLRTGIFPQSISSGLAAPLALAEAAAAVEAAAAAPLALAATAVALAAMCWTGGRHRWATPLRRRRQQLLLVPMLLGLSAVLVLVAVLPVERRRRRRRRRPRRRIQARGWTTTVTTTLLPPPGRHRPQPLLEVLLLLPLALDWRPPHRATTTTTTSTVTIARTEVVALFPAAARRGPSQNRNANASVPLHPLLRVGQITKTGFSGQAHITKTGPGQIDRDKKGAFCCCRWRLPKGEGAHERPGKKTAPLSVSHFLKA